ncbi:hypothetical protein [Nitrosomonas sp. Is37]|uniref:hypothetical protein n=1 Tax=Nitrosomonas sp. Is37 TaxID=3080535 RepID=UPI00294AC18B|nr:hypothetical protein [Nitrosomonas sp. Is37]MDV6343027.1 hypothetical protein [Nitrosomonas sp. Is37]
MKRNRPGAQSQHLGRIRSPALCHSADVEQFDGPPGDPRVRARHDSTTEPSQHTRRTTKCTHEKSVQKLHSSISNLMLLPSNGQRQRRPSGRPLHAVVRRLILPIYRSPQLLIPPLDEAIRGVGLVSGRLAPLGDLEDVAGGR